MKPFLSDNFLLQTKVAEQLYFGYAQDMPIIDYHNHLPPQEIAEDKVFVNMTQIWLKGDHYKWRAMRANGIDEDYITGQASDYEKFMKWAETVPYTLRNPLYHWTHLELKNPFGIEDLLDKNSAIAIYENCNAQLKSQWSVQNILKHFNVKALCTTDDPIDDLKFHQGQGMFPTFRPDKAMSPENLAHYNVYLDQLSEVSGIEINSWDTFLLAMQKRHDFFASKGCRLSDHGLETMYAIAYTETEIKNIFQRIRNKQVVDNQEIIKFKSACLYEFAKMDFEKAWVQQFHLGAIRNTNSRLLHKLGADAGVDSIGDFSMAQSLAAFFDRLEKEEKLTKTIIYNLNPADNEVFATMIGNYQDGKIIGKMQFGSGWWFLDQKDGMEKQINALSNMGLLSRFVGMLTDSRSFLSFSRHEYFRRILCNLFGNDIENGELPHDIAWVGKIIQDICYYNAERYFNLIPNPSPTSLTNLDLEKYEYSK
ncbi:MAG: glucuronate isomerase [Microscillaceae bacterium]|jgi:glucuronate isomerase|nr:glucuronate isomerase [Microscillaceae bacterium]